ncbi:MAG: hypothetical protein ABSH01_17530, partial [Terriglobia bacterium]
TGAPPVHARGEGLCESRMREIRTSGSTRGEERCPPPLLLYRHCPTPAKLRGVGAVCLPPEVGRFAKCPHFKSSRSGGHPVARGGSRGGKRY